MLYRRYNFDPHDFILKSFKMDKSFKIIVAKKKYFKFKKKKLTLKKIRNKYKFMKSCSPIKNINFLYSVAKGLRTSKNTKYLNNSRKKWYSSFWSKIKFNYFQKKKRFFFRKKKKRWLFLYILKKNRRRTVRKIMYKKSLEKRKQALTEMQVKIKRIKRKAFRQKVWLYIKKFKKRAKTWWLLRIAIRKAAIYYGFKKLKRFRFAFNVVNTAMSLKSFHYDRLESMLNMFLLRINIFDNIFVANNFIKRTDLIRLDGCPVFQPFTIVKTFKIVSFTNVKKMQSIFKKRCMFSKYFYLKKYSKQFNAVGLKKLVKIVSNVPNYIHYDYQIMCFCTFRKQNKKENYRNTRIFRDSWSIDTQLQYN